jgi:hypothetical protein
MWLASSVRLTVAVATIAVASSVTIPNAQALDFFRSFFGGGRPAAPPPPPAFGFGNSDTPSPQQPGASGGARSTAYCVRTCDGRYFPISANNEQSRAATCSSLCPASETKVYHGSSIDDARSESGKPYSSLPNAFKYREQFVNGCTCNGKSPVGLASVDINDDKTLRKGDIVAGENGLIVASRPPDRKRAADFTPAPDSVRAKFERSHAMMHAPSRKAR